jgi:hypothetical protein
MSRGPGVLQRRVLETLADYKWLGPALQWKWPALDDTRSRPTPATPTSEPTRLAGACRLGCCSEISGAAVPIFPAHLAAQRQQMVLRFRR